ncbi:MAG: hydrogenase expression/formation protein HypE [bacterium]|nr:hydrogenase expression/formation protein HypE [bacterium]MDT8366537.1 hydrogenase expression/formation protein HypE [bacterium]
MIEERILLSHGAGGKKSSELTERIFLKYFSDPALLDLNDMAVLELPAGRVSMSTDTYVVDPIFFPGGDIGSLAVHGTVNDVAMAGAVPVAISVAFILEEGLPLIDLERIAGSMALAAAEAGVRIVTADTKVVPRGAADKVFINTTGIGIIPDGINVSGACARIGDRILLSGTIGDHGIAIASARDGIAFKTTVKSDSAPLNWMISELITTLGKDIHVLRDPTRGGLATVLCEIASQSSVGVKIEETAIPVKEAVKGACELLGYDPLYLANEGKLVGVTAPEASGRALEIMKGSKYGQDACIIGEITGDNRQKVILKTAMGGSRLVDKLSGEMLPRIC